MPSEERTLAATTPEAELGIGPQSLVRELGRANKRSGGTGGAAKGALGSIGRAEEQLVYMAGGCGMLTVSLSLSLSLSLCPGLPGKGACHSLRSAGQNASPLFRSSKFPVNVTSAIADGFAARQH